MRVLVYEWCCATAAREDSSRAASLWTEGWAMLSAAVEDFRRVAGVEVSTVVNAGPDEPAAFRAAAVEADYALVIAPEFDRILETRCRWAVEAGAMLLGPSPEGVALMADKLALAKCLRQHGVPTPQTSLVGWVEEPKATKAHQFEGTGGPSSPSAPRPTLQAFVAKPRYGAGSQDTFLLAGDTIVQPFVPGRPASVSFLIGPRQTVALMPAWQDISDDGRFHYRGGSAPLPPDLAERAVDIARQAIDAVDGLAGYVGVDLMLNDECDQVIEINPRLTTSYAGLRLLAEDNLMEVLLRLVRGESVPAPRWRRGTVSWTPDGATDIAPA